MRLDPIQVANVYLAPRDRDGRLLSVPGKPTKTAQTDKERFFTFWKARGPFSDWMIERYWQEHLQRRKEAEAAAKRSK